MSDSTVVVNDDNFDSTVIKSSTPVLVDFWAPWCGPCVAISPLIEDLAKEYKGKVTIAKMNVDDNANTPATYGVRSIPFIAVFKGGKLVDSIVGAVPKAKLVDMLQRVC
jgi:thioredoxin 1